MNYFKNDTNTGFGATKGTLDGILLDKNHLQVNVNNFILQKNL